MLRHLRAANALARRALEAGHHPFGALLVAPDGETVLMEQGNVDAVNHAEAVLARARAALEMQFMFVMPTSGGARVNNAQLFQWLQEKALVSMGALLFNPTPGLALRAADLTRNLIASAHVDRPLAEQERVFAAGWLARVELPCAAAPARIDALLAALCDAERAPIGATEQA